jgi:hypothetical protein
MQGINDIITYNLQQYYQLYRDIYNNIINYIEFLDQIKF